MIKNKSESTLILLVLFLLGTLVASLFLVKQRQVTQKKAAGDTTHMTLAPKTASKNVNDSLPIVIWLNTGTRQVQYVKVIVNFDKTKLNLDSAIELTAKNNGLQTEEFPPTTVQEANSTGSIRIILSNTMGTTMPSGAIEFARLPFKVIATGSTQVTFDITQSQVVQDDTQAMTLTAENGTYDLGGGSTPTPTATGQPTATPTATGAPSPTPTGTIAPTPTSTVTPSPTPVRDPNAPTITRFSNYCGTVSSTESESVLVLYGTKFGATQGTSKVTFKYKSDSTAADSTYKEKDVTDYVSWSDQIVVVKVPAVDFGKTSAGVDRTSVVSKVVLTKAGFTNDPSIFPAMDNYAFFEITHLIPKNIGDVNCSGWVNFRDYTILFNNYDKGASLDQ
jgi:hypothetical protein